LDLPRLFNKRRSRHTAAAVQLEHRMRQVHASCDTWAAHVLKMRSYWWGLAVNTHNILRTHSPTIVY